MIIINESRKENLVPNNNNTIFDDVFRTMVEKIPELVIPLLNEVFGTDYQENTSIIQMRNEHQTENGERITDSTLKIGNRIYHIECQSTRDPDMVMRMGEYDFVIALENTYQTDGKYYMKFPYSCVVYIRERTEPEKLQMIILMPDGKEVEYNVPVMRAEAYTIDDIFQKKLTLLLPYYIIRYKKNNKETDEEILKKLTPEYKQIVNYLNQELLSKGKGKEYRYIVDLIIRVADYTFADRLAIRKGIGDIMGGKVLELETDRIINQSVAKGSMDKSKEIARKLLRLNHYSIEEISAITDLPMKDVEDLR